MQLIKMKIVRTNYESAKKNIFPFQVLFAFLMRSMSLVVVQSSQKGYGQTVGKYGNYKTS